MDCNFSRKSVNPRLVEFLNFRRISHHKSRTQYFLLFLSQTGVLRHPYNACKVVNHVMLVSRRFVPLSAWLAQLGALRLKKIRPALIEPVPRPYIPLVSTLMICPEAHNLCKGFQTPVKKSLPYLRELSILFSLSELGLSLDCSANTVYVYY